jgi:hypothetical protein
MVAAMSFYSPMSLGYLRFVIFPSRFAPITRCRIQPKSIGSAESMARVHFPGSSAAP